MNLTKTTSTPKRRATPSTDAGTSTDASVRLRFLLPNSVGELSVIGQCYQRKRRATRHGKQEHERSCGEGVQRTQKGNQMATITKKQYEAAIAIINAFNAGKETKMSKKATARKSTKNDEFRIAELNGNLSRVTATTEGKTGWGVEFTIAGMGKKDDLTHELFKGIREEQGYNFMKAEWKEVDGEWVRTRECFFWQSFPTKKARDAEVKRLSAYLAKPETKSAPKSTKKSAPKSTKKSAPKSTPKKAEASTKDVLLSAIGTMSLDEKKALIAALFA